MKEERSGQSKLSRGEQIERFRARKMWEAGDYAEAGRPQHLPEGCVLGAGQAREVDRPFAKIGKLSAVKVGPSKVLVSTAQKRAVLTQDSESPDFDAEILQLELNGETPRPLLAIVFDTNNVRVYELTTGPDLGFSEIKGKLKGQKICWVGGVLAISNGKSLSCWDPKTRSFVDPDTQLTNPEGLRLAEVPGKNSFFVACGEELLLFSLGKSEFYRTSLRTPIKALCASPGGAALVFTEADTLQAFASAEDSSNNLKLLGEFDLAGSFGLPRPLGRLSVTCDSLGKLVCVWVADLGAVLCLRVSPFYSAVGAPLDEDAVPPPFVGTWMALRLPEPQSVLAMSFSKLSEGIKELKDAEVLMLEEVGAGDVIRNYLLPLDIMFKLHAAHPEESFAQEEDLPEEEPEEVPKKAVREKPKVPKKGRRDLDDDEDRMQNDPEVELETELPGQEPAKTSVGFINVSELEANFKQISVPNIETPKPDPDDQLDLGRLLQIDSTGVVGEAALKEFAEVLRGFQRKLLRRAAKGFEETRKKLLKDLEEQISLHFKAQEPDLSDKIDVALKDVFAPYVSQCVSAMNEKFLKSLESAFCVIASKIAQKPHDREISERLQNQMNVLMDSLDSINSTTKMFFSEEAFWAPFNPRPDSETGPDPRLRTLYDKNEQTLSLLRQLEERIALMERPDVSFAPLSSAKIAEESDPLGQESILRKFSLPMRLAVPEQDPSLSVRSPAEIFHNTGIKPDLERLL